MNKLYELREKIIDFYNRFEVFILPVVKLIIAFIVLRTVNSSMGYFSKIDNIGIELVVSLLCSFLPSGFILVFAGLFSLLHMYGLSLVVLAIGVVVYLILYIMFFRFAPKAALVVAITPILMAMKLPCVIPVALGLIAGPGAAVAAGSGVVAYYFLKVVNDNAEAIKALKLSEFTEQLRIIIDGLVANKGMIIVVAAMVITIVAVYIIRRLPIKRNWEIAIGAGVLLDLLIMLIGGAIIKTGISVINVILASILAAAIGFVIKFFGYCVDFERAENVQFEDDDYYYYVKAVPKINLGIAKKKSKGPKKFYERERYYENLDDIYDDGIDENYEYSEDGEYYEEGQYDENAVYDDTSYDENAQYDENGEYIENYEGEYQEGYDDLNGDFGENTEGN